MAGRTLRAYSVSPTPALALALTLATAACTNADRGPPPRAPAHETAAGGRDKAPRNEAQLGFATWYGAALAGRPTASGERFDPEKMTAAHRSLAFGTWVEVVRMDTGQSVRVRITDRGPYGHADRIIDLSHGAARELGILKAGVVRVEVRVLAGP